MHSWCKLLQHGWHRRAKSLSWKRTEVSTSSSGDETRSEREELRDARSCQCPSRYGVPFNVKATSFDKSPEEHGDPQVRGISPAAAAFQACVCSVFLVGRCRFPERSHQDGVHCGLNLGGHLFSLGRVLADSELVRLLSHE